MAEVTSKDGLINYALRKLGAPVIEINVDREQAEDRVDEALQFFTERHFDGVEKVFFSHQLTQTDIDNRFILTDDLETPKGFPSNGPTGRDIVSVTKVFQFGALKGISSMFDVRYQMALSDYFGINTGLGYQSSLGLASFDSAKRYISMIEDFFQPEKEVRFSKVTNRLLIDSELDKTTSAGNYLIIEAYAALDPEKFGQIYNDRILKKYVTALIKKQWGSNLSKFAGVQLPGGVQLNGPQIYAEAVSEIKELVAEPMLVTGDNAHSAQAVADQLGIGSVVADVLPESKIAVVRDLQAQGKCVAMVGDGVNDAAALAQADLGIAMGSGSDVAIEASDITLVRSDPRSIVDAIRLSRRTLSTIKGNLFWAFAYNIAAIPLAVAGLLNPMIAGAAMAFSSVFVVGNSLRLRRFQSTG